MNKKIVSYVRRALSDQRGQVLPWVAFGMVAFLGTAGLTTDIGHAYVVRSQLQNITNAAALAGAGDVYNTSSTDNATTVATQYSAGSGGLNANSSLGTVTTTVTTKCLNLLMPAGSTCGTGASPNAIQVTNSVTAPTYFLKVLGISSIPVSATAVASMQGVANSWNIAIIVDATSSMSTADSSCGGLTEFRCALAGVQTLLATTNPGPNSNVRVALFSFPNLSAGTSGTSFSLTNTCGNTFTNEPYTLPTTTATTYAPIKYTGTSPNPTFTATYQITAWDSGYYESSDTATHGLNPADNLVKTVGYGASGTTGAQGTVGCLPNVGGESTYYGSVIYSAEAALEAEQASYPNSQNALILISDGQAQAAYAKFPQKTSTAAAGGISVTSAGSSTWSASATNLTGVAGTWGQYPDFNDECQQAIVAAQAATAAGTKVYAVAYGSEDSGCTSSGGGTDTHLYATGNNAPFTLATLTPCVTMENIASSISGNSSTFYSDFNESGSGSTCQDASHSVSSMQNIFSAISSNFTTPRLIPNNAT